MIKISNELMDKLVEEAKGSERKRTIMTLHESAEDKMQRMLNVILKESKIDVHKHSNSDEVFIPLRGKTNLVFYNEDNSVKEKVMLDPQGDIKGVEVKKGEWHSLVPVDEAVILFLAMQGPYNEQTHKVFPGH